MTDNTIVANNADTEEKQYSSIGEMVKALDLTAIRKHLPTWVCTSKKKDEQEEFQNGLDRLLFCISEYPTTPNVPEVMEELLKKGANPNFHFGHKPCMLVACLNYNMDAVNMLLKYGGDINSPDGSGNSPLMNILKAEEYSYPNPPPDTEITVEMAIEAQNNFVQKLIDAGADINWQNIERKTALHYCAFLGKDSEIDFLMKNNADPTIETISDNSIAAEFVAEENDQLFEKLEAYRTNYKPTVSTKPKMKV